MERKFLIFTEGERDLLEFVAKVYRGKLMQPSTSVQESKYYDFIEKKYKVEYSVQELNFSLSNEGMKVEIAMLYNFLPPVLEKEIVPTHIMTSSNYVTVLYGSEEFINSFEKFMNFLFCRGGWMTVVNDGKYINIRKKNNLREEFYCLPAGGGWDDQIVKKLLEFSIQEPEPEEVVAYSEEVSSEVPQTVSLIEKVCERCQTSFSTAEGWRVYCGRDECRNTPSSRKSWSDKEIVWLESIMKRDGIHIRHQLNGEKIKIDFPKGSFQKCCYPDGYCAETNTIYEFYGDYWHGNPAIYDREQINPKSGRNGKGMKTFGELYDRTMAREQILKDLGYNLVTVWENEFDKGLWNVPLIRKSRKFVF